MDEKKSAAYKKLVEDMWGLYPKYGEESSKSDKVKLWAPYIDGENLCKEINFYTYWQGFGYAENTPKIKYLLVAQDWDNPFAEDLKKKKSEGKKIRLSDIDGATKFIEKIKKMNAGEKIFVCDENDRPADTTNKNLIELFKILGYDILSQRYADLFFTNFCLGYLTEGEVTEDKFWLKNDSAIFKELCEILQPENILCLGQFTSECAYEALSGAGTWKKIYGRFKRYSDFIENHAELTVNCGNSVARFFPLAHCGEWGTMNRNKVYKNGKFVCVPDSKDLGKQKKDWKKIYEVNK